MYSLHSSTGEKFQVIPVNWDQPKWLFLIGKFLQYTL